MSFETRIVVGGETSTAEAYRNDHGLTKDQYRDMIFELCVYGNYTAPNGDEINKEGK